MQTYITANKSKAQSPWCLGVESGAASGWPGTDWIEDIVLRQAGPDVYQQWYQGKVKWTDAAIKTAWTTFGDVVKNSFGGSATVNSTNFANAGDPLFKTPPGCMFLHQASFIVWLVVTGLHVLLYAARLPRAVLARQAWSRIGLVAASLVAGAVLAGGAYSFAAPWLHHRGGDDRHEGLTASAFA